MSHHYEIILYWRNADGAVAAEVPELSGCMAHRDTQEPAIRKRQGRQYPVDQYGEGVRRPGPGIEGRALDAGLSRLLRQRPTHPETPNPRRSGKSRRPDARGEVSERLECLTPLEGIAPWPSR